MPVCLSYLPHITAIDWVTTYRTTRSPFEKEMRGLAEIFANIDHWLVQHTLQPR